MQLSELRNRVYSELSEEQNRFFDDEEINQWLNEGLREIAKKAEHLHEVAHTDTSADVKKYSLPSDFLEYYRIEFNDDKLEKVPMNSDKDGFWIWGEEINLTFNPSNNDELGIYYIRIPEEMINDTDTPELEVEYQDLLIQYSLYRAYQKDEKYQQADIHYRDFQRGIVEMQERYSPKPNPQQFDVERL